MFKNFRYIISNGNIPPQSPFQDTGREFNDGKKMYKSFVPSANGMTWQEAIIFIDQNYPDDTL